MGRIAERLLGATARVAPRLTAFLDWVQPKAHVSWDGPMNGQAARRAMVIDLVQQLRPAAVIETGTYRGQTTGFLADISGAQVHSIEESLRFYTFAKWRLSHRSQIYLTLGESSRQLSRMAKNPFIPKERVLFYLDAHWEQNLPLRDELRTIAASWTSSVVVIDDFEVPGDPAYKFDDYGPGAVLSRSILPAEVLTWTVLYPSTPGLNETGHQRGCVVLCSPDLRLRSEFLVAA